jgi:hypothetical protein
MFGAVLVFAGTPASAQQKKAHDHGDHKHAHPTAQHGGVLEDVGEYHVELLIKDGTVLLHVRDHDAKETATDGFKAIVLITAGSQRVGPITLESAGGNKMEGAVAAVPSGATAILTLTDKDGDVAQGRFKLK